MEMALIPDQDPEKRPAKVVQDRKNHKAFHPGASPVIAQGKASGKQLVPEDPQHGIAGQVIAAVQQRPVHFFAPKLLCSVFTFCVLIIIDGPAKSHQKRWLSKKPQMQGAQILRNEAYIRYAAVTKDTAQVSVDSDAAVGEFLRRHHYSFNRSLMCRRK
jgi:hypothetical protein